MSAREHQRRIAEQQALIRRRKIIWLGMLVAGIVLVGILGINLLNGRAGTAETAQPHPTEKWAPVTCSAENVTTTFTGPVEALAGHEVMFSITVENQSDQHPCYFDAGWSNVDITVTSGDDRVMSTKECQLGDENKQLLLDRSASATFTVSWPGGIGESACTAPDVNPSQPGTYVAHLTFVDNSADTAEAVFVMR